MQFQINGSQEVRKFVVGFIEEACKKDPNILSRVIPNLRMMLNLLNESVDVVKRVIRAMTFLYKLCLQWLSKVKIITENMEAVWSLISEMKNDIIQMLDSDNDGLYDLFEAGIGINTLDLNNDGQIDLGFTDNNTNGASDIAEIITPLDSDADGLPDVIELDSDDDDCFDNQVFSL